MSVERSDSERVVITGMGWVTPLGHDLETVWKRLMAADSGMAPVTRFDAATFPTSFAAEDCSGVGAEISAVPSTTATALRHQPGGRHQRRLCVLLSRLLFALH